MPRPNQIEFNHGYAGKSITEADLLRLPDIRHGEAVTSHGLSRGVGSCWRIQKRVVSRSDRISCHNDGRRRHCRDRRNQIYTKPGVSTQDHVRSFSAERVANLVDDEVDRQCGNRPVQGKWRQGSLVESMLNKEELDEFLLLWFVIPISSPPPTNPAPGQTIRYRC
jgi:hypothetical protein